MVQFALLQLLNKVDSIYQEGYFLGYLFTQFLFIHYDKDGAQLRRGIYEIEQEVIPEVACHCK